jgi:hypothetical protein
MLEAMLLTPILRPLISGIGVAGDYELSLLAEDIAQRDGGFTALLARHLGKTS